VAHAFVAGGQVPGVSVQQVKKVLAEMKKAGHVRLAGRGRGAKWEVAAGT
jgi:hypothetical protein